MKKIKKITIPINDKRNILVNDFWKVRSFYVSTSNDKDTFYHLHHEFVHMNNDGVCIEICVHSPGLEDGVKVVVN